MENKIPKVIHYCWFGGGVKSEFIKQCIGTWRAILPDYTIKEWNESNFDIDACEFTRDAYAAKKWAFVSDYARLKILYDEGGVYMDTDVKVMKSFDEFLDYNFFSSHEIQPHFYETELPKLDSNFRPNNPDELILGWSIHSAIMASVAGLPYLKDCMEYYQRKSFYAADGSVDLQELIIGKHITINALKYGYRYE
ncbi:MAG: glycosyltransferase, partial [Rikenellaceae bacterium]